MTVSNGKIIPLNCFESCLIRSLISSNLTPVRITRRPSLVAYHPTLALVLPIKVHPHSVWCPCNATRRPPIEKRRVRLNDLVHAVWAAIRIFLRAIDKIIEACHAAAADLVRRRTRDDFSAVIGTVTDEDDQKTHNFQKKNAD
ncbi:hypothetical protein CBA19CS42_12755 [Caballeronia novacaledonica]|uniref:Uncharacterized protein n=1 Tax=Caballeronia novacaledonica TaxID=1544861 RepID=A0AA37IAW0_9BURK|nr:hypothetical protein CBA19CS42_12755 [Caballeronia novacaledonica]